MSTAKDLGDSLRRGEGYAALPGLNKRLNRGIKGSSGGRASVNRKPKETKPNRGKPIRNRRGRVVGYEPAKPTRRGISNIPPQEGTGKGSPNDKKTTKPASTGGTKTTKPKVKSGGSGSKAKDAPSNSKKNPYRVPQGSERKDRMSRVVRELQEMQRRSRKRQGKKMSKAVSKGYPGNRNY